MSATDTTPETAEVHHGPSPREYVQIALILGVLTAAEISTYIVDFGPLGIPLLIGLMVIKFAMVANFFMHLKFDSLMYTRLIYGGLGLAATLYTLALVLLLFGSGATAVA